MIRKADFDDIESIEDTYNEHFKYENEYGAFTVCLGCRSQSRQGVARLKCYDSLIR